MKKSEKSLCDLGIPLKKQAVNLWKREGKEAKMYLKK